MSSFRFEAANLTLPMTADQRPICFSNPAVQREEAATASIRQISTPLRRSRTAAFGQANEASLADVCAAMTPQLAFGPGTQVSYREAVLRIH